MKILSVSKSQSRNIPATVKWFKDNLGYGFLIIDGVDAEVFVHHSEIVGKGWKTLEENETVLCDFENGEKGLCAYDVIRIERPAE